MGRKGVTRSGLKIVDSSLQGPYVKRITTSVNIKMSSSGDIAISFCNMVLSSLYEKYYSVRSVEKEHGQEQKNMITLATISTFQSILTIHSSLSYEVEEVIRYCMRMRFLYCDLERIKIFVEHGLIPFFRECLVGGERLDHMKDCDLLISKCVAVTLCASLDKCALKKVSRDVILYVLRLSSSCDYKFRWIIHEKEISDIIDGTAPGVSLPSFWEPLGEIDFFICEGHEKQRLREDVINMKVCGRAIDNIIPRNSFKYLLGRDTNSSDPESSSSVEMMTINDPDEDKMWLSQRNPYLFMSNVDDYLQILDPVTNQRMRISDVKKSMNWCSSSSLSSSSSSRA